MSVITLVCSCGMKMKAPGAVPGRVGKCPRCGSFLKVPDATAEDPASPPASTGKPPRAPAATYVKSKAKVPTKDQIGSKSDGLVPAPRIAETRFVDSLLYPLRNASGIGLLMFMPPLLWMCTAPIFAIASTVDMGGFSVIGVIFLVPQMLLMLAVGGYLMLFLGQVLVSSALGEVMQPRSPGWDLGEIGEGLGRWSWALVVGLVVGGLPALAYWITCGDVDLFDKIVLIDLLVPGLAYAQMALLATLMYESPLAANPVTVTRAILRVGWSYIPPCVESTAVLFVLIGMFMGVIRIKAVVGQAVACWAFWVIWLYMAMVELRRLGLFCYRNAVVLDWFPDRTRRAS